MAFSLQLVLMSSSPAVFREITLRVLEQIPHSTLWREKSGVEEGRNGEEREMENGKTQKEKQVEAL